MIDDVTAGRPPVVPDEAYKAATTAVHEKNRADVAMAQTVYEASLIEAAVSAAAPLIAASERERITAERDAWRELAEVRSELLACYRIGKYPSERLLRRLDAASAIARDYTPSPAVSGTDTSGGDRD